MTPEEARLIAAEGEFSLGLNGKLSMEEIVRSSKALGFFEGLAYAEERAKPLVERLEYFSKQKHCLVEDGCNCCHKTEQLASDFLKTYNQKGRGEDK